MGRNRGNNSNRGTGTPTHRGQFGGSPAGGGGGRGGRGGGGGTPERGRGGRGGGGRGGWRGRGRRGAGSFNDMSQMEFQYAEVEIEFRDPNGRAAAREVEEEFDAEVDLTFEEADALGRRDDIVEDGELDNSAFCF